MGRYDNMIVFFTILHFFTLLNLLTWVSAYFLLHWNKLEVMYQVQEMFCQFILEPDVRRKKLEMEKMAQMDHFVKLLTLKF